MLVLLAAATMAMAPPPPTSLTDTGVNLWRKAYVAQGEDVQLNWSNAGVLYGVSKSGSMQDNGNIRAWFRWEYFSPMGKSRSATTLMEGDCSEKRIRLLATDQFPFNNLQGGASRSDEQQPEWQYARPGTMAQSEIETLCAVRDSMAQQAAAEAAKPPGPTWTVNAK